MTAASKQIETAPLKLFLGTGFNDHDPKNSVTIKSNDGLILSVPGRHRATAERIVRAVNSHDALGKALGKLAMAARAQAEHHSENRNHWQALFDEAAATLSPAQVQS